MSVIDIPGSPGELERLAERLRHSEEDVRTVQDRVAGCDEPGWTGEAANAYHAALGRFPAEFGRAEAALGYGATAIARFAAELAERQHAASRYSREIGAAQEALDHARAAHAHAEHALSRELHAAASNPAHLLSATVTAARAVRDQAATVVDQCVLDVKEWWTRADANYEMYRNAVRACTAALSELTSGVHGTSGVHAGHVRVTEINPGHLNLAALTQALTAELPSAGRNAIAWARSQEHESPGAQAYWNKRCLEFVYKAFLYSSGVDITKLARTGRDNPITFWKTYDGPQSGFHRDDRNPPAGALVFWGPHPGYPDGHIAISLGNGKVVTTQAGPVTSGIGEASLSQFNGPYLGWIAPQ